jgi:BlaI family penicillinase repressor
VAVMPKKLLPQISDAEWAVMEAVWDAQPTPLTAGEVVQRLSTSGTSWAPRTIKTLLARLVQKGAVASEADGRRFLYRAKVARDAVVRRESRSFLSRVFGGAVAPAVVHLLENADLTPQEIEQLRQILDREGKP